MFLILLLESYQLSTKNQVVSLTLTIGVGIYSVNVDYDQQKVIVWGICNKYDVLETIRSKRKEARFWNQEGNLNDVMEKSPSSSPSHSNPPKNSKPYLILIRAQSFKWKALKKVFSRTSSFWILTYNCYHTYKIKARAPVYLISYYQVIVKFVVWIWACLQVYLRKNNIFPKKFVFQIINQLFCRRSLSFTYVRFYWEHTPLPRVHIKKEAIKLIHCSHRPPRFIYKFTHLLLH